MFRQNYWKISIQIHFDCVEQENWTMILKKKTQFWERSGMLQQKIEKGCIQLIDFQWSIN